MLFVCLGGVALRRPAEPEAQVGRGSAGLDEMQRQAANTVANVLENGRDTQYWVERGFVGFCHLALGSTDVARQTLERVVRSYPGHGAAALASARLADLSAGGTAPGARAERSNEEVP